MIETKIQMRFADVDMLGHVNNVNQHHYFDLGKSDFFRRVLGMKPVWKSEGLIMVSTRTDYRRQIRMEDPIVVTTCVDRIGHKSFTLRQQIVDTRTREVRTECATVLVAFDFERQESIEIPAPWREKLASSLHEQ